MIFCPNALTNYEKHAPRVSQVIAAVAKVSCKHGLWLVARVKKARQIKRLPVVSSTLLKSLVSNIRLFFILAHFSEESIPNVLRVTYEHQYTLLFTRWTRCIQAKTCILRVNQRSD